jgi:thioredoxin reductase (NADPH)
MYDLIIIGAGPAGLTAGLYAGRARLETLILEKVASGGRILMTEIIENFPGFVGGISTQTLIKNMEQQVKDLGVKIALEEVIELETKSKTIKTDAHEYKARAVIIATGAHSQKLGLPREVELIGRGVSYCATCDGPLFKNKKVAVVGAGNTAAEEALYLTRFAKEVTLIHRRNELRASKILQERLRENKKISFFLNSVVSDIKGKDKVEAVIVKDVKTQEEKTLACDGIFIYVGIDPNTAFLKQRLQMDDLGFIITDEDLRTSEEGIFACGDCRKKNLYQVITACSEGAIAAESVAKYLG